MTVGGKTARGSTSALPGTPPRKPTVTCRLSQRMGKRVLHILFGAGRRSGSQEPDREVAPTREHLEDFEADFEPLVARLRNMEWPQVSSDVRDRCWQDFQRMMAESDHARPGTNGDHHAQGIGEDTGALQERREQA